MKVDNLFLSQMGRLLFCLTHENCQALPKGFMLKGEFQKQLLYLPEILSEKVFRVFIQGSILHESLNKKYSKVIMCKIFNYDTLPQCV